MKTALKITFGTILAVGVITTASAEGIDLIGYSAIHVNGAWTKATENGLSYGDSFESLVNSPFGSRRAVFVHPDHNFDWGIGYTYHFPCTKTRLFFHYDHFSDGHRSSAAANLINLGISDDPRTAVGIVHDQSNEYSLGIDRRIAFGSCYVINTAFFLEWDKVERSFYERIDGVLGVTALATRTTYNRFKGFGPGVGIKGHATPFDCSNIGIFASLTGSMLYGNNNFQSIQFFEDEQFVAFNPQKSKSLVNKFDITLGFDYEGVLQIDCSKIQFSVALGMRYLNYINIFKNGNTFFGVNSVVPIELQANPNDPYAVTTGWPEDWGRFGPFLQFRIGGANA